MADIRIVTVGDKRKFRAGVRVALKAIAPPGTSDYEWLRNNVVVADASTNQHLLTLGEDTAGYYTVRAKVGGKTQTSDAVRISIDDTANTAGNGGAAPAGGGTGSRPSTPEEPATYHSGFALASAVFIVLLGVALYVELGYLGSRILTNAFWTGLEGRLKIAIVLGLPATVVGLVVILVGLWMALVEWRGRLKDRRAGASVASGAPSAGDVKEIIAAVGNLRGAALAMVVGAILLLGTAWVAQSAAGTAGPGDASSPTPAPAATSVPTPT